MLTRQLCLVSKALAVSAQSSFTSQADAAFGITQSALACSSLEETIRGGRPHTAPGWWSLEHVEQSLYRWSGWSFIGTCVHLHSPLTPCDSLTCASSSIPIAVFTGTVFVFNSVFFSCDDVKMTPLKKLGKGRRVD